MSEQVYSCADCKHSRVSWAKKLFSIIGISPLTPESYYCNNILKIRKTRFDPVCGYSSILAELERCVVARASKKWCGEQAKHWKPKRKKDLFRLLAKDYVNE